MDEHRIGLKPILRRVWAPKGATVKAPSGPALRMDVRLCLCHPKPRADGGCSYPGECRGVPPLPWPLLPRRRQQRTQNKIVLVLDRGAA